VQILINAVGRDIMNDLKLIEQASELYSRFTRVFGAYEKIQVNKFGLTIPQSYTLLTLFEHKIMAMNELATALRVTQTTMTRVVDNLVRDGYIDRIRNEEDRRVVEVKLTDKGIATVKSLKELYLQATASTFDKIPSEMRGQVVTCLSILLEAMEEVEKEF
jgi:DNA-binding MarR family transcriptional regulator